MKQQIQGKRLTIYTGDAKLHQGKPLYLAVLQMLKDAGITGATATKGFSGFSLGGNLYKADSEYLMADLPVVIEAIDEATKIDRALNTISSISNLALIEVASINMIVDLKEG
jgi:uncharacterized protein